MQLLIIVTCRRGKKATDAPQQQEGQTSLAHQDQGAASATAEDDSVLVEDIKAEPDEMQTVHPPEMTENSVQEQDSELPSSSQEQIVQPTLQAEGKFLP